jgi:hypothetical protein
MKAPPRAAFSLAFQYAPAEAEAETLPEFP